MYVVVDWYGCDKAYNRLKNIPTGCNTVHNDTMLMQVSSAHQMTVGEHLINWLNSLDTSEMTVQQLRKAMNEKFMKLGMVYYVV